ncbi:phage tail protein [Acinetobacter baumannii]|uniref:TipJ family phage tail tip protein n=2 Tax=Bacteria TaxID=2 RepID=UPI00293FC238|nr:phage tail protein [Acinetobacter baumannii]MDV4271120.1 phage tail protein [Acinetobacter baumannii]
MAIVKGAKKGKGEARKPVVAPDSAQSKTYIKILYGLGEGEIEGLANGNQSIFLEGTPLQDANGNLTYSNVKLDFRKGTNDQDYIEGFPSVESETAVDVELKSGTPWVRAFNNIDLDAVRIRLKWGPLRQQDSSTGDVSGITIEYAIDIQTDGGAWTEVLKTKISDKTSANYERAHRIDLPKADSGWLIRVRRITPNSTSEFVSDKMYVEAFTEVVDAKLRYPNTALLGLQYDAETFGNVAKLAVDLKGRLLLVPTNYNPQTRQYTGIWDGTFKRAYTNNPAWIYYDLCTNDRYGLGNRLTPFMIDKWSLYRLAQYCDQSVSDGLGGQEPRFTCNVYIQNAEDAFSILMKLAGVFRAIAFWDGTSIICDADIPQDTYFTYTRANVVGGVFEYSGTRARDRHNVVKVAWDNPANHYKTEYEFVRDENAIAESGQVRILELDAWGCTSRGQAQRAGHWALKSEQKETRTVSFKVGLDGHIPLPGRVIEIADELFAGRANGGRVSKISADLKSITIDRDDVIAKAGDRLVINGENGKAQTRIVQSISGRVITVTLPFDENSIAVQNVWVLDAQDLATMKFRVISISQEEKHQFSITALQYNPQKFDEIDNGAFFEDAPISIINPSIQEPVKDVLITTESRVDQGINITTMIVSWMQAKGAVKYLVEWRKDDGSWIRLPQTGNNSVEVPGVYSGQYQARVTAISAFEIASLPVTSSLTEITGKQGLPPKIAFIRVTGILFGMKLDWGFPPTGAKDTAYTEIEVSPDGINNIAQLGLFAYPTTTTTIQGLQPNLRQFYRGRLIDRIGNVGPWSEWVNGTTTADPEAVLDLISGHINESDLAQELQGKIENSVDVSEAAQAAANNAQAVASSAQTAANNAQAVASEAKTAASSAQSAATSAQTQASSAQKIANDASVIATNAKNTANNASTAASKVASDLITSTNLLNQKIADESSTRIAAISNLNDGLTTETTQRKSEDAALLSNIETYKSSTNGTLSSLQTQITTNATNTSANATQINALDSRLTTNESKTNTAISSAATAQTTANTAVSKADAASMSINTLKSTLRVQADALNIDPHFVSGLEYYTIAETPAGNSVTHGAYGENGSLGIRVIKSNTDTSAGTNTNVNTNRTDGFFLKANNTYRAIVRCKLISGTGSILGRFHRKSDNAVLASATLSVTSTSAYVDLIYTYKPTSDVLVYFGTWVMASGTIDYDSISIINATDAVASDANASAITNLASRVTNAEGTLTSQGSSITQLNNNIVSINGTLASKADASTLSSLANRVTTTEGNISSQGGAITSLQNNVSTINNALASKADSIALSALDSRVTTTEGTITSQGASIASLQNSLSSVGVNLVALADQLKTVSMAATTGESYITWSLTDPALKPDTYYTLSFWAVRTANVKSVESFLIASNGAHHKSTYVTVGTTNLVRYSVTFKTNADAVGVTYSLRFDLNGSSDGNNATLTIQKPQLEEGQVATYWKPSTYDKADASALSTLQNTVTQQGNTLTSNSSAITSLQNSVTNINNALTSKADASAVSSIDSKVTTIDGKVTSNTANITSLNNSITNGSLNLVYNTLYNDLSNITANGNHSIAVDSATYARSKVLKVTATGAGQDGVHQILMTATVVPVLSATEPLVLSFYAKADAALSVKIQLFGGTGAQSIALTPTWTKYTITSLRKSASHVDTTSLYMSLLAAGVAYFTNVQLERGTIATSYSAASTETGNLIAANASALSSLSSTVTQQGNTLTSQGNSLTSLNNSLVTTNNNVATAQKTANDAVSAADAAQKTANTKADASALEALSNTVTSQGGTLTSQGNSITSLNNSVTNINNALTSKADASAVSSIDSKVTTIDGKVTSNTANITSLNNSITNGSLNLVYNTLYNDLSNITANGNHSIAVDSATYARSKVLKVTATGAGQDGVHQILMTATVVPVLSATEPLVLSFYAKADAALSVKIQLFGGTGAQSIALTPTWTKYTITSLRKSASHVDTTSLYMSLLAAGVAYFTNVQLERGTIATSYSAASTETGNLIAANASALSSLSSTVTQQGNTLTSQGNSLTSLNNSLVTTNNNVATAQKTANDAVSAADAAQKTANTKADASALEALSNTVTSQGGTLTSQGNSITSLNNSVTNINNALASKADSSAITSLDSRVTATENGLTTTNSNITSLQSAIQSQGDALNLDPNFREGLKFITVGELATGNSIVAGNYGEGGGTGLRVTKSNDAGTSGTNSMVKTPTSGMWLKAGRTYQATIRARKVSGTAGLLLRWIRASDSVPLAVKQVTATDTTNFVDFSLDYAPTSDVFAWFGVWMYPNAGVVDYSSIRLVDKTASLENAATASAVSSLTSRVASAEGTITSQGNSIVSLNNSVSNINGALATKADNAALSSLDSRVTATENSITSQGNQITSLQAGLSAAAVIGANLLSNTAAPNSANQPKTSDGTASAQGFSTNFNIDSYFTVNDASVERYYRMTSPVNATSVLRASTTYTISADVRGAALPVRWRIIAQVGGAWSDIAVKSMSGISNNQYTRQSCTFTVPANATSLIMSFQSDSTTVGNALAIRRMKLEQGNVATLWEQPIGEIATSKALSSLDTRVTNAEGTISSQSNSITQLNNSVSNINGVLASKADASALSSLDSKVSVIDGKVSTQASSITTLQTTVGGNTAAIQQVTESVDGVKAQQYLKMDVNGHLAGHGSMNDGTTSTFIFNYDTIQFGAPVGVDGVTPKPIMSLLNTPLTLPNGTVIPRGLYVDSGSFGYINANRIWAENLSTISADLGDIEVDNAHIKNGAIDTLKIQDEAVTVPSGVINQTERKFYFAVSNSMAGSVGYTQDLVTLNVQTQGGKLRIDGSFVFDCKVRITQYPSSYDILKCVTLACRVLVNGTVAYTQEIYPTFYDGSSTIRFIGVTATPVYILPASTGTKTIVLQLAYITKYSNIYYGSFEAQGGFAETPTIVTMSSLSTLELKK